VFKDLRSTRCLLAFDADVVLNGTGNAGQVGNRFAGSDFFIDGGGSFEAPSRLSDKKARTFGSTVSL